MTREPLTSIGSFELMDKLHFQSSEVEGKDELLPDASEEKLSGEQDENVIDVHISSRPSREPGLNTGSEGRMNDHRHRDRPRRREDDASSSAASRGCDALETARISGDAQAEHGTDHPVPSNTGLRDRGDRVDRGDRGDRGEHRRRREKHDKYEKRATRHTRSDPNATPNVYEQASQAASASFASLSSSFTTAATTFTSSLASVSAAAAQTPLPAASAWQSVTVALGVLAALCGAVSCVWWLLALAQCLSGGGLSALSAAAHPLSGAFTLLAVVRGGAMLARLQGLGPDVAQEGDKGATEKADISKDDPRAVALALPLGLDNVPSLSILLPIAGLVLGIAPVWAILTAIQLANLHKYFNSEAKVTKLADILKEDAAANAKVEHVVNSVAHKLSTSAGVPGLSESTTKDVARNAVLIGKGVSSFLTDDSIVISTVRNVVVFCAMIAMLLSADYSRFSRALPATPLLFVGLHYLTAVMAISLHLLIDISSLAYRAMKTRSENPSGFFFPFVTAVYRLFISLSQANVLVQALTIVILTIAMSITGFVFMSIGFVIQKVTMVIGIIHSL